MINQQRIDKIKQLKAKIQYEHSKMSCCAYGKSDLRYLEQLKLELKELEENVQ